VRRASLLLLPVIYLGYISLGLPDGTLGVGWPHMQKELSLPFDLAGQLVLVATSLGMISSLLSARIIARFATAPVVFGSCVLTATGLLLISQSQAAWLLFLASVPLGIGSGAVDSSLNGYVAKHYSRRHMNWLHACWGIGATCGPLLMTRSLLVGSGWRGGFLMIGAAQLGLALVFLLTLRLWDTQPEIKTRSAGDKGTSCFGVLSANSLAGWLSALAFPVYVGIEGAIGLWANSVMVISRSVPQEHAGVCIAAYYASITGGRLLVGFLPAHWASHRVIQAGIGLALAGGLGFMVIKTQAFALPCLILLGLGFAPIFPGLMHEVPSRFRPEDVQKMIGRQGAAAYLGAAFAPPLFGWLVVRLGLECVPFLVLGGTAVLLFITWKLERLVRQT